MPIKISTQKGFSLEHDLLPGVEEAFNALDIPEVSYGGAWAPGSLSGLAAEHRFIYECLTRGIHVLQPIGNHLPYDFVVYNGRFLTVQVKACSVSLREGGSPRSLHKSSGASNGKRKVPYAEGDWDILAYYIAPDDNWFIMPFQATPSSDNITLSYSGKYLTYLDNWSLLSIQPCQ